MSSVLHPVGPKPPQTYWVRRAVVIGAAILALIIVIAVMVSRSSSGSAVAQPTPTPTPGTFAPPPYASTPAVSQAVSPTPNPTPSPTPGRSSSASPSTASAQPGPSARSSLSPKAAGPLSCPANQLRATITGDQDLVPGQPTTVSISLINGSGATCTVKVGDDNFELKVYSGIDRIWSSKDCSTAVKGIAKTLAKDQAVGWKMTWDGRRSKDNCQQRPEIPHAGTYFATAQYAGAKPTQLRMILRS